MARDVSSSSITAGSSPKLFRKSGEPEPDEVDTLALRCFANALYGEDKTGLLPERPSACDSALRCCGPWPPAPAVVDEGEIAIGALPADRGLNISAIDDRRLVAGRGPAVGFVGSAIVRLCKCMVNEDEVVDSGRSST